MPDRLKNGSETRKFSRKASMQECNASRDRLPPPICNATRACQQTRPDVLHASTTCKVCSFRATITKPANNQRSAVCVRRHMHSPVCVAPSWSSHMMLTSLEGNTDQLRSLGVGICYLATPPVRATSCWPPCHNHTSRSRHDASLRLAVQRKLENRRYAYPRARAGDSQA